MVLGACLTSEDLCPNLADGDVPQKDQGEALLYLGLSTHCSRTRYRCDNPLPE